MRDNLARWVRGENLHDRDTDTCCPDYSCCRPELAAPPAERRRYYDLSRRGELWPVLRMRLEFLRRTLK